MPHTRYTPLENRAFLAVRGPDAAAFLQGLFTINTLAMAEGALRYGLLLSPQGRFLHDFFITRTADGFLLETPAPRAEELAKRLNLYRLRANITLEAVQGLNVYAVWGDAPGTSADPRNAALPKRLYATTPPEGEAVPAEAYVRARMQLGVPEGEDFVVDRSLPLDFGLDALHAVDFDKGCYVGQEVTARMQFRSERRKKLYVVQGERPLPAPGTRVMQGEQEAGELRACLHTLGLAVLKTEAVASATPLQAHGITLMVETPAAHSV